VISDGELILRLQSGSLHALGELYDRHQHLVFRTALAVTGDGAAAADLLQDVFLRMHRFVARIDPERPLEPWLYRATTNLTYIKCRKRWLQPLEDMVEWLAGGKKQSPAYLAEKDEEWQDIHQAITGLSLSQRMVVVLYYINDLSLQEISEVLVVPVGTVKSRLYYGRQALKTHLESNELTGLILGGCNLSLPKMDRLDTIDLSLRRTLKNWVNRKNPPARGKKRLIQAAASDAPPRNPIFSEYMTFSIEHDTELYLYRLKMTDVSSLRVSAFGLC